MGNRIEALGARYRGHIYQKILQHHGAYCKFIFTLLTPNQWKVFLMDIKKLILPRLICSAITTACLIFSNGALAYCEPQSLTAEIISDVVTKNKAEGQGNSVSSSEFKDLLQDRTTLNVGSAHKYIKLLGIRDSMADKFAVIMNEIDVSCSTPNGHFKRSILFDVLDVTGNDRLTSSDVEAYGYTNDEDDLPPDNEPPVNNGDDIFHVGTEESYRKGDIIIKSHRNTKVGDLLVLFLHRTDGPVKKDSFDGWTFLAKCEKHPTSFGKNSTNCDHDGKNTDLGQTALYRVATSNGEKSFDIDMSGSKPTWAILTTLRNANVNDPMRDAETRGYDKTSKSRFPSVDGKKGDMLLMSQSFDDKTSESRFQAPHEATQFGYVYGSDETGFLYGKVLTKDGRTGDQTTKGSGDSSSKDAMLSITIKPAP